MAWVSFDLLSKPPFMDFYNISDFFIWHLSHCWARANMRNALTESQDSLVFGRWQILPVCSAKRLCSRTLFFWHTWDAPFPVTLPPWHMLIKLFHPYQSSRWVYYRVIVSLFKWRSMELLQWKCMLFKQTVFRWVTLGSWIQGTASFFQTQDVHSSSRIRGSTTKNILPRADSQPWRHR